MKGIYIVGGYPDRETFFKCVQIIENNNFDFIEIGIPFSEPVADGPVIMSALNKVIASGVSVYDILEDIKKLQGTKLKVYVMTYSNIVYGYGIKKFSEDFGLLLKGIILADVPNRMHNFFYERGLEIPIIPFVTPESREQDIQLLKESRADFIYYIGIRGITGQDLKDNTFQEFQAQLAKIKKITDKPVIIGFGIKSSQEAKAALEQADGFVIGTAAVAVQDDLEKYSTFLKTIT
jgi:tryptophan synthase alpha chain